MEIKAKNIRLSRYIKISCLMLGFCFFALGFVLLIKFDAIYDYVVRRAIVFNPTSEAFKVWRINDPPLVLNFYLFNWTNSHQMYNTSVKPRFEQVGPYRYNEVKEKVNIKWHKNNTITFKYVKRYYYIDGNLDDLITTVNPVLLTAVYKARFNNFFSKLMMDGMIRTLMEPIIITKTARELLFDGYDDQMLSIGRTLDGTIPDKFGFFYKRNDTLSPHLVEMYIGQDDAYGNLLSSNYQHHSGLYESTCGEIRGSSGEFFPINVKPTSIEIYSPELCKFANLVYEHNVTIKGITAFKFGSKVLFDNGTINPENECFCDGECVPTGVQNVSTCRNQSPTFLSLPHFYNADPSYTENIDGLRPEKSKHELQISLEPKSAIPIDSSLRMQINMLLQPIRGISKLAGVPRIFVPMFFFDQTVTLADDVLAQIKIFQDIPEYSKYVSCGLIIVGAIFFGIAMLMFVFVRDRKKKEKKIKRIPVHDIIPLNSKEQL